MFTMKSTTPGSCSTHLAQSIAALIMALHVSSIKFSLDSKRLSTSCNKTFVVGPGHASIPAKLVNKITNAEFLELVNFLSINLYAANLQPQSLLDGKVLVHTYIHILYLYSKKKRRWLVEVEDILTLTEVLLPTK